jgi:hypothetical protein
MIKSVFSEDRGYIRGGVAENATLMAAIRYQEQQRRMEEDEQSALSVGRLPNSDFFSLTDHLFIADLSYLAISY